MGAANTPLLQGTLDLIVLQLLKSEPKNGTAADIRRLAQHRETWERFPGALSVILAVE